MFSSCPICQRSIPLSDIEWHTDSHFVEDDFSRDLELAKRISLAPPSSAFMEDSMTRTESSNAFSERTAEASTLSLHHRSPGYLDSFYLEKITCLVAAQTATSFHKVEVGLMALLRRCLEMENGSLRSVITGHVDHYESIKLKDSGWGCGWRNIQMLSSHLLVQRQDARNAMFGGSGYVPSVSSLQRWLEIAWDRGFDTFGSNSFNHEIYGSNKWIGTTECATLFRSFRLRARIVDFDGLCPLPMSISSGGKQGRSRRQNKMELAYGPMDKFLCRGEHDASKRKISGHQVLVDWVWNYFMSNVTPDNSKRVFVSDKTPLYFQHDGHSRTVVGIQREKGLHGLQDRYVLLILDPSQRTEELEMSLRANHNWQKLVKRGVHTLKKPQYQVCYIDPGIANDEEMERLKTIDSTLIRL